MSFRNQDENTTAGGTIVVGSHTPADAYANPSDAVDSFALGAVFNGTTWDRVRSASADNLAATGIPACGGMLFDGVTWDRARGDSAGGAWVQGNVAAGVADTGNPVKAGGLTLGTGGTPPNAADGQRGNLLLSTEGAMFIAGGQVLTGDGNGGTPVGFLRKAQNNSFSPVGVVQSAWNGASYDRIRTVGIGDAAAGTGIQAFQPYGYNGATYDRIPGDATRGQRTYTSLPFNNITTNATTVVKSGAGTLHGITVNTAGTGSTATIYDNTAGSGTKIATVNTAVLGTSLQFNAAFATGLTIVTAGAGAADITCIYG